MVYFGSVGVNKGALSGPLFEPFLGLSKTAKRNPEAITDAEFHGVSIATPFSLFALLLAQ